MEAPTDIRKPPDPVEEIIMCYEGAPSFIEGWQCFVCGGFIPEDSTPLNKLGGHKPPTTCPECGTRCKEVNPNL